MNYNLYHIARPTVAEALAELRSVADAVHHLGGALWPSLTDVPTAPSYVVIALPVGTTIDALAGLEPVAEIEPMRFEEIDPAFTPQESDEAQPVEQPAESVAQLVQLQSEEQTEPQPEGENV
jgi:hypothetical protein